MARRKMRDEFQVHGHYGGGWEEVAAEDTLAEAKKRLKEYRDNERGTAFKVVRKRVPDESVKITSRDVSATKQHNGSWEVAAMVDNHRKSKVYYGYSKRDAIAQFVREVNEGNKNMVSDDERDRRARLIRNQRDDAVIASGLDLPILRGGGNPGGRVVIDRSKIAPAVVRAMDLLATRVNYEGGRFLSGEVLSLSQADRDAIDNHLVSTQHLLSYQPGTQADRIAAYAKEWAKSIGPRMAPGTPDPRD